MTVCFLLHFSCLFFGLISNLGRSSRSPRCRANFSLSNAVSGIVPSICLRKWWSSTFPSQKWKRTAETPARLKSHVIFMTNGIVSSHFTHADHEYAIGIEQSLEYRKILAQTYFRRFFMFFRVSSVFDDFFSDIKLETKSRRHEYCLKLRALQNP